LFICHSLVSLNIWPVDLISYFNLIWDFINFIFKEEYFGNIIQDLQRMDSIQ